DQWLAPRAHGLSPQQMEILRCRRRLANLHVVARGKLKIPLDASARVLRPLAFIPVRKKHDDSRQQSPLVFTGGDELVHYDLGTVGKVSKLGLPQYQRLGIVAAVAVLEAEHS